MVQPRNSLNEIPWVEKYRPSSLNEIASQTTTIKSLKEFVNKKSLPHMIFTGPAGTGKTSAARSLINDLIGKENLSRDIILERNASDNVRMETRGEIKNFVNHTSLGAKSDFKFVILDEADNIPKPMQSALRRIIEMAPANVKFIFMCNFVERIIDPVLSRCAIFRFYPLPENDFKEKLNNIALKEEISVTPEVINAITFISQGDLRKAINLFQTVVALVQSEKQGKKININPDIIYEISGFLTPSQSDAIYEDLKNRKFNSVVEKIHTIRGLSSRGVIHQILGKLVSDTLNFPDLEKIVIQLAEFDYRLSLEADQNVQIDGLMAAIISAMEVSL